MKTKGTPEEDFFEVLECISQSSDFQRDSKIRRVNYNDGYTVTTRRGINDKPYSGNITAEGLTKLELSYCQAFFEVHGMYDDWAWTAPLPGAPTERTWRFTAPMPIMNVAELYTFAISIEETFDA